MIHESAKIWYPVLYTCTPISMDTTYSMRGHFINTICDSRQTLSFVYFGIFIKNNTKGLIWITA